MKLAPDNPAVIDTLGWILLQEKDAARGMTLLAKAVELAPKSPEIRFHFVQGLHQTGQSARAKAELERLLIEFPRFSDTDAATKLLRSLRAEASR
jgi:predicted Zn-dependent protease